MILKISYKITTKFKHVLVAATNVIRASSLYKLKHRIIKNCLIMHMHLEPFHIIYQCRAW
jgi:hypothetical protein